MRGLGPRRTRFARSDVRIAYEVDPRGLRRRPWLLMIQGLGFDRNGWKPVTEMLRRHFRLILMDNRGCGASQRPERPFAIADLAGDAVAVLDAAGVGRAHVLGASLGGMVAQEVAIGFPDRVDRLVLACTTPGWPAGFPMPGASLRLLARTRGLPPEEAVRRHVENALSAKTVENDPALVERLVRHELTHRSDPAGWSLLNRAGAQYYGGSRQTRITASTLVLQGSDDTVVDPRNATLLANRIPEAELKLLPGLGHLFFWERPSALTEPVIDFLQ